MSNYRLPDKLRQFFIHYQERKDNEKIVVGITKGWHATLHFGSQSKMLDFHVKDELNNSYYTVLKIRHFTLFRMLVLSAKLLEEKVIAFIKEDHYMNLGKLGRHNLYLIPLDGEEKERGFSELIKYQKSGKKVKFKNTINLEAVNSYIFHPSLIMDLKCQFFSVVSSSGKFRGFVVKNLYKPDSRRVHFFTLKDYYRLSKILTEFLDTYMTSKDFQLNKELIDKLPDMIDMKS